MTEHRPPFGGEAANEGTNCEMLETYLDLLELGYFEAQFAFEDLAPEKLWKRPAEGLLSIGELAGHISYWEATRFAGGSAWPDADLEKCKVKSPLIDPRFSYYYRTLETPPSPEHLAMTPEQVWAEMQRIHQEAVTHLRELNPDLNAIAPVVPEGGTWLHFLKYLNFHISYHIGQMYSVRHLLGDKTNDN